MEDPRENISDVIVRDQYGAPYLARAPQFQGAARRGGDISVTVDFALHPCRRVDDGVADIYPMDAPSRSRTYGLADMPPTLAKAIAEWLKDETAAQAPVLFADVLGTEITEGNDE